MHNVVYYIYALSTIQEVVGVTNADPQVIAHVNDLVGSRFELEVEREAENRRFQSALAELTRQHDEKLDEFTRRERRLDTAIWSSIDDNQSVLIARGKRSFVTLLAKFQLKKLPAKVEMLDKAGIMESARRLGVVKKIATPPKGGWRFNQKKFLAWLEQNGELRKHFEPYINRVDTSESLTVKPNANYTVEHNSERVSPPSISIKKS